MSVLIRAEVFPSKDGKYEGVLTALRSDSSKTVALFTCKSHLPANVQTMLEAYAQQVISSMDRPTTVSLWTKEWEVEQRS